MQTPPSGTVTFVLTDVVGSTRLWQSHPDVMDAVIARHVDLITSAVTDHDGMVLKLRGEGDSTFSVFSRARHAVDAAVDARARLAKEPWAGGLTLGVRFAVHTGEAVERDGDYFGPVVNRAARLRSIAAGGEILVSGTTAALVVEDLRPGLRLVERGDVALRDLDRAEHVFAVEVDDRAGRSGPDVRLLGPVEIRIDGRSLDIGGPKERTVACLLSLAGGSVTHDRLIDDLWDASPPRSARKTLQTYVWRLRQALGDDAIQTSADGYLLRLPAPDLRRFERLVGEGAEALHGDPETARERFGAALGLWRGEPFSGAASTPTLTAAAAMLAELRDRAQEGLAEAALALGRHIDVVGDLERLVQASPLREERWRLLVIALYRSGRQAEALRAYQRARSLLRDELGIEPGAALRDLEQAVLEQRTDLDAPRPASQDATKGSDGPATTLLPLPPSTLVGRVEERRAMAALIHDHRLVTITGTGGAGKTRLALAVAAERAGEPDVRFCDLSTLPTTAPVAHEIARATGERIRSERDADGAQELVAHIGSRQLFLVLDNCEHVVDAVAEVAGRLLVGCSGLRILATSREPLGVASEQVYQLAPLRLPPDGEDVMTDAVILFEQRAAEARADFALGDDNRDAVVEICRQLDGLPLAIELAAARMSQLTASELQARLTRRFELLRPRRSSHPRQRTLLATIEWSHELLSEQERTMFRRLAVFSGRFTAEAMEACCTSGMDEQAVDVIGGLVDKSLVVAEQHATTEYRLLETVRRYAEDRLAGAEDEECTRTLHCAWLISVFEPIPWDLRLLSLPTAELLEAYHQDLRRALDWAKATHRLDLFTELLVPAVGMLAIRGHFEDLDQWMPVAIECERDRRPSERFATALSSYLYLTRWNGDTEGVAVHRKRLAALIETFPPGHPVTAYSYASLASLCSRLEGERAAMERYADLALEHAPADAENIRTMAICQKARAMLFRNDPDGAIELLSRHVTNSAEGMYSAREDLALALHLAGEHARALALVEPQLGAGPRLFRRIRPVYAAIAAAALGDGEQTHRYLRMLIDSSRSVASQQPLAVNDCLMATGVVAFLTGDSARAAELLASLGPFSVSINSMMVLLEHYQQRVRSTVSPEQWREAERRPVRGFPELESQP